MNLKREYIIPLICIFNVLIHVSSIAFYGPHRDELLFFSQANHPALGYASVPPMITWIALIMKSIFGFNMIAIKLMPALMSGIFVYLGAKITKHLGGNLFAQVLTCFLLICCPMGLRAFILFQPVPLDIVFWTALTYVILRYTQTKDDKYLCWLGAVAGVALFNKYLIALQLISFLAIIPFTTYRNIFSKRSFYVGLGICILIMSPNIYWQISNNLPVLTHMSQLEETQLQHLDRSKFFIDQITMFWTSFIVAIVGAVSLFRRKTEQLWIFPTSAILVIGALILLNGKAYYAAGVYPFLIAGGAVSLSKYLKNKWSRLSLLALVLVLILPLSPLGIPFLKPAKLAHYFDKMDDLGIDLGRIHEDGQKHTLPQDFADMLGWKETFELTKIAWDKIEDKSSAAIYAENYGLAGAVALYGEADGLPEPLSFSDSYQYWVPESFDPDITSFIYINDEMGSDVKYFFLDIELIGEITDIHARQNGVKVYLCTNPRGSFNEFWGKTLERVFE